MVLKPTIFILTKVEFLPVYRPNEEERNNPQLYAKNVQQKMADSLNLPITDHSYDDVVLQMEAKKLGLSAPDAVVGAKTVQKLLHMNSDTLQERLREFASLDKRKKGKVCKTIDSFLV